MPSLDHEVSHKLGIEIKHLKMKFEAMYIIHWVEHMVGLHEAEFSLQQRRKQSQTERKEGRSPFSTITDHHYMKIELYYKTK